MSENVNDIENIVENNVADSNQYEQTNQGPSGIVKEKLFDILMSDPKGREYVATVFCNYIKADIVKFWKEHEDLQSIFIHVGINEKGEAAFVIDDNVNSYPQTLCITLTQDNQILQENDQLNNSKENDSSENN